MSKAKLSDEDKDEALYPVVCSRCGHDGEAHEVPSQGGQCHDDGAGCDCLGFKVDKSLERLVALALGRS